MCTDCATLQARLDVALARLTKVRAERDRLRARLEDFAGVTMKWAPANRKRMRR